MVRGWMVMAALLCSARASGRICDTVRIYNNVLTFEKLRGCSVVVGDVFIVLMEKTSYQDFMNISFPELTEIKGHLVLYRVWGLTTLANLFPNLAVIRGEALVDNYAIAIKNMPDLHELGLKNLRRISRGSIRIEQCPNLCYVKSVDWSKVVVSSQPSVILKTSEICEACPDRCNGRCWNQDHCQLLETDKSCDSQCIGCRGPTDRDCLACTNYNDNGRCVSTCPKNKIIHPLYKMCVTEEECLTLTNDGGVWWTFQGQCLNTCPVNYTKVAKEEGWCKYCGEDCVKEYHGDILVDSVASAQILSGCTHVNGNLALKISSKGVADELENNLGLIKEITGYLKILRSPALTSLEFLKKLKVIHGKKLDSNRHALVVFENNNLYKLWDWNVTTLTIKNGTISFHYNSMLCYSEIKILAEHTGIEYSSSDVSEFSNGDKAACRYISLKEDIINLTSTKASVVWEPFVMEKSVNDSYLIGYTLYYSEDLMGNLTVYDDYDECNSIGWDTVFVSDNMYRIEDLKPYTLYAYYIKTYTTSLLTGGQTKIKRFRTLSDNPSVPLNVGVNASTSHSIILTWKPPEFSNGVLSYYDIVAYPQEDDPHLLIQRDYCKFPHQSFREINHESSYDIWSPSSNTTCCARKQLKIITEQFDDLCDSFVASAHLDSESSGCRNYMDFLDRNDSVIDIVPADNTFKLITHRLNNSSITKHEIQSLESFSLYIIILRACNNASQCSNPVITSHRTQKDDLADNIPGEPDIQVENADVLVKWLEPRKPNSLIVSYEVKHRRTDVTHSGPAIDCITQKQFVEADRIYRMRNFLPGSYSIRIRAVSLAGLGDFTPAYEFEIEEPSSNTSVVAIVIPVVTFITVFISVGYYMYYKKKHKLDHLHLIADINPDYAGPIYVEDEWEMERDDIIISKGLGHGTFGMVYQGLIKSKNLPCALKTVNEHSNVRERIVFLNEASVMKSFSDAHHVVKLLGVVSRGDPPLVVMELMSRGDLKSYLRKSRESSTSITSAELYRTAAEIADGMMYLSARKFVHRDLAARNCMVAADRTVKIGDFGMTRDIYETDYYRKETRGLMPVRWMAPESLADGVFTTDSDVWSYGVVLWEMATLAEQPYQGLANDQVLQFVIAQGTLQRPPECPDLLYEIMEACWKWRPNQRPLFSYIVEKLESHVGQNFKLVSFFHSAAGEEYRMNSKNRVYNAPALSVPLSRNKTIHWNASEDDVSLYSSMESNHPTPMLSTYQNQSQPHSPSSDSYH